jgi:EAL domain-containing protein (putative c-di-GMP-specific phosphodiesterase class I)
VTALARAHGFECDAAIAHSVISLADELGIDVAAEGIETPEQATMLLEMGCRYGQAFLFGRPEPASHPPPRTARPGATT